MQPFYEGVEKVVGWGMRTGATSLFKMSVTLLEVLRPPEDTSVGGKSIILPYQSIVKTAIMRKCYIVPVYNVPWE
jgi:hypothetical protein